VRLRPLVSYRDFNGDDVKVENDLASRKHLYSLGIETESGLHYIAILVSNQMVDHMEYYKLNDDEYEAVCDDGSAPVGFADSCRRRERDDRLFMQPGTDRGVSR
jgi:hypothetical protein